MVSLSVHHKANHANKNRPGEEKILPHPSKPQSRPRSTILQRCREAETRRTRGCPLFIFLHFVKWVHEEANTDIQKHTRKHRQNTRLTKEKIKKAHFLYHPLIGCEQELGGAQKIPKPARREQQGLVYTSQLRRREVHRFAPWPDEYSIKHEVRSQRSGALVASGYRGGESSVSCVALLFSTRQGTNVDRVCFPDLDQGEWTYNRTMERALFKEPYRVCLSIANILYLLTTCV